MGGGSQAQQVRWWFSLSFFISNPGALSHHGGRDGGRLDFDTVSVEATAFSCNALTLNSDAPSSPATSLPTLSPSLAPSVSINKRSTSLTMHHFFFFFLRLDDAGRGGAVVKARAVVPRGCVLGPDTVVGAGVHLPEFTR